MSDSDAAAAREAAKQEARLASQRFATEQKALGRVNVSGWVPREIAAEARTVLASLLAGETEFLPASVAARAEELQGLRASAGELAETRAALAAAQQALAEARQSAAASLAPARQGMEAAQREAAQARGEAAMAREAAASAQTAIAEAAQRRDLAETQLAEALADLARARAATDRLQGPGLRPGIARLILG